MGKLELRHLVGSVILEERENNVRIFQIDRSPERQEVELLDLSDFLRHRQFLHEGVDAHFERRFDAAKRFQIFGGKIAEI
jgi:hypothetical protein